MESVILNQRYQLDDLVGAGGMATVYRGLDLLLDRPVAVKILREPYASTPAFRERFIQEARAAARLDHPNIVHIYDVGEDTERRPYIVMELVEGEDLKSLIQRERPIPVSRALSLARQICAGVGHAHRSGLVHCDLKPQNILITAGNQVKVADFGIARAYNFQEDTSNAEKQKFVWGSPHYIAPEQATGDPPTPASDVYSLGIILYEMLTGVPPFHAQDPAELAMKHLQETPPLMTSLNPRIPPGLEWLVSKVLSKEPANRYRNADQFGIAIEEYARKGQELTRPQLATQPSEQQTTETKQTNTTKPASQTPPQKPIPQHQATPATNKPQAIQIEEDDEDTGVDWLMWGLMIVAVVAVVGLLPLWQRVYTVWAKSEITPPPLITETTATPTLSGEPVTVPQLKGLGAADAQRLAEGLQLNMTVIGEQETTDARPGTVLEQTPSAGTRVVAGNTIEVILAQGRLFEVPDVVGYQLETIRDGLESQGLLVEIEETGSQEAKGVIITQQPSPGGEIRAGETMTLTISGGANAAIPLQVNLNNTIILESAQLSQSSFRPGSGLGVTLRWRCSQPVDSSYKIFVHLLTPDLQTLIAQHDTEPVNGLRPTNSWTPGEIISDPHQMTIPAGTAPGIYQIRVGLYNDAGRMPVIDAGNTEAVSDSILVTTLEIQ